MNFSIITPSFNSSRWLKLCIASVADQAGVEHEHIVQDACSTDGTGDWLPKDPRVKVTVEKDAGMYDAVNRGLKKASGDILAYLNADEQYLPGGLAAVAEAFERHPEADIVLADTVIVDDKGGFISCRKSLAPTKLFGWLVYRTTTSSIFFRKRLLKEYHMYFDARWRGVGDHLWMREALRYGLRMSVLRCYTSTFTETGENLSLDSGFFREQQLIMKTRPVWAKLFHRPLSLLEKARSAAHGIYWEKPFSYAIYTADSPDRRRGFRVEKPTGVWWQRHKLAEVPFESA